MEKEKNGIIIVSHYSSIPKVFLAIYCFISIFHQVTAGFNHSNFPIFQELLIVTKNL